MSREIIFSESSIKNYIIEFFEELSKKRADCIPAYVIIIHLYFYILRLNEIDSDEMDIFKNAMDLQNSELHLFEKLIVKGKIYFCLIKKINIILNELILEKKIIPSQYPPEIFNFSLRTRYENPDSSYSKQKQLAQIAVSYLVTYGNCELHFEPEHLYNEEVLNIYREKFIKRKRIYLLQNLPFLESFDYIYDYNDYSIPRGRWSDLEGKTVVEIQFFRAYVVLFEKYVPGRFDVSVVNREIYESQPEPYLYLKRGDGSLLSGQLSSRINWYYSFEGKKFFDYQTSMLPGEQFLKLKKHQIIIEPEMLIEIHLKAHSLVENQDYFSVSFD